MSRLSIEISPEQHQQIKAMAVVERKSIKDLVLDKLFDSKSNDDEAWKKLMQIMDKRIEEAENGAISKRSVDDIAQDVIR